MHFLPRNELLLCSVRVPRLFALLAPHRKVEPRDEEGTNNHRCKTDSCWRVDSQSLPDMCLVHCCRPEGNSGALPDAQQKLPGNVSAAAKTKVALGNDLNFERACS